MEQKNKKEDLLKKARLAVWLNRYFKVKIPPDYERFIIAQECCDERFMTHYLRQHRLQETNEEIFFKKYLDGNIEDNVLLVKDYVVCHGAYPKGQILVMQSKDVALISALISHYAINGGGHLSCDTLETFVKLGDAQLLYDVLTKQMQEQFAMKYENPQDVWNLCYETAIKQHDIKMLEAFSKLRFQPGVHFTATHEKYLFWHGTEEMIKFYLTQWQLFDETLEDLTDGALRYPQWEDVLKTEIERRSLPTKILMNLVKLDKPMLLREHYKRYGLPPEVLAFYANQKLFKQDVGLED